MPIADEAGWIDPSTGQWIPNLNAGAPEPTATEQPAPSPTTEKPDFTQGPAPEPAPTTIGATPEPYGGPEEQPAPITTGEDTGYRVGVGYGEGYTPSENAPPPATYIPPKLDISDYDVSDSTTYENAAAKYDTILRDYETRSADFDRKWTNSVQDGQFVGSDAEYQKYLQEYKDIEARAKRISKVHAKLAERAANEKASYERDKATFEQNNVQVGDGRWIPRDVFSGLSPEYQTIAMKDGYDAVYSKYQKDIADFEQNNVKLPADLYHPDGTWITKESFGKLPKDAQQLALTRGLTALQNTYEATNAPDAAKFLPADVYEVYKDQSAQDKFAILKAYGVVPADASYVKADAQGNPMYQKRGDVTEAIVNTKNMPLLIGDVVVPGFATVRHWKEMGAGEKAFSIALDALILIPLAGAAGRGARASYATTRAGRTLAAAKGVGKEALLQLKAPIDTVLHPIETVKGTVGGARNLVENVVSPRKLSEVVVTTTQNTVRIPISRVESADDAMKAGDTLMKAAKRVGDNPVIEMNGVRYELARSPLMKELGGGLAHGTPMGQNFADLQTKVGKEFTVKDGLYLSHEPATRFVPVTAGGQAGPRPTIVILSPKLAEAAGSSQKFYKGTKELESVLPDGFKIPPYTQRLYTRIGPDHLRVDILLVDNKLSPTQIAKLKGLAAVEDFKAVVTPGVLIAGSAKERAALADKSLSPDEVRQLARELRASGNSTAARTLIRASGLVGAGGTSGELVASGTMRSGGRYSEDILTVRATGTPREPPRSSASRSKEPLTFRTGSGDVPGRTVQERLPSPDEIARRAGDTTRTRREGPAPRRGDRVPEERRPPSSSGERHPPPSPDDRRPPSAPEDRRPPVSPEDRRLPQPPDNRKPPLPPEDRKPPRPPEDRRPPRPPDERKPPHGPVPVEPPRLKGEGGRDWTKKELESAAAWNQGIGIWAVKPPGGPDDWKFWHTEEAPVELKVTDRKTAYDTIRLWKGTKTFEATKDLGIVFVDIKRPTKRLGSSGAIAFRPDYRDIGRRRSKPRLSKDIYSRKGTLSRVARRSATRMSKGGILR